MFSLRNKALEKPFKGEILSWFKKQKKTFGKFAYLFVVLIDIQLPQSVAKDLVGSRRKLAIARLLTLVLVPELNNARCSWNIGAKRLPVVVAGSDKRCITYHASSPLFWRVDRRVTHNIGYAYEREQSAKLNSTFFDAGFCRKSHLVRRVVFVWSKKMFVDEALLLIAIAWYLDLILTLANRRKA